MRFSEVLHPCACIELVSQTRDEILDELAVSLVDAVPTLDREGLFADFVAGEKLGTTGTAYGLAFPHVWTESLDHLVAGFARSQGGVAFGSADGQPSHLFFAFVSPSTKRGFYLQLLQRLTSSLASQALRERLLQASTFEELRRAFDKD